MPAPESTTKVTLKKLLHLSKVHLHTKPALEKICSNHQDLCTHCRLTVLISIQPSKLTSLFLLETLPSLPSSTPL